MLVITNGTVFVSAHRVQIATGQQYVKAPFANFVSAHRVQIATWSSRPITDGTTTLSQRTACRSQLAPSSTNTTALLFVSAHRVQIATHPFYCGTCLIHFVSAHRVQIATDAQVILLHQHHLCLSAPRADRNPRRRSAGCIPLALSQRTACRSQPVRAAMSEGGVPLCLSAPRADRNGKCAQSTACGFVECAVSR